jgi:hypothetical protein
MIALLTTLSLLSIGLLTGAEAAVALFIHPVLYGVSDLAHATVAKPLAAKLGRWMPLWYPLSFLLALGQSLVERHGPGAALAWTATAGIALISAYSILLPVPINNKIARMDPQRPPADWLSLRRRWDLYHGVRVVLLVAVDALLIAAALRA